MLKICTTVVATLAVAGIASAQDAVQWTEAEGGNGHWYEFRSEYTPWPTANNLANSDGGYLVTVQSSEERDFIKSIVPYSTWIGAFQDTNSPDYQEPAGGWIWANGEAWNYSSWASNEPNNNGNEDYAYQFPGYEQPGTQPLWYDGEASATIGYTVEWSADCNDDGLVDYGQILDGSLADDNGNGVPDCCDDNTCVLPIQWKIEDGGNGHWYQATLAREISWLEADQAASEQGGYLATMTSAAENQLLATVAPLVDGFGSGWWLGGLYDHDLSQWTWISDEPWEYTSWGNSSSGCGANQPDGRDAIDFYCIGSDGAPQWSDDYLDWNSSVGYVTEWSADCNDDGIVDYGQILDGTLEDLNQNGVPDCCDQGYACFPPDCNNNGIDDSIDLANGTSQDCNSNEIPDECDIADGVSVDCNGNLIPDECESLADCDSDGTPDACEILDGAIDANPADGIPDECQGLPMGACCHNGGCVLSTFDDCFAANGSFAGNGISCDDANCPAPCPGDIDGDGQIGIVELLIVIDRWGFCP